jgi:colicin import membrane protein
MALVNFEAVAAAAEALQIAGQRPSVRAVIAHLGGGSPNAVLKHLGEWKAGRPVVRIEDTALDARITSAIIDQMQRVAVAAAAAAEERAAGIDDDLQALAEAQQAAEQQIEALTTERDTSREQSEGLARQLAEERENAERNLQHGAEQAAALRSDLAGERKHQEKTAAALAKAEVRLEALPDLHTEIERLRAALDAESKARAVAEQQAAVLAAKLEDSVRHASEIEARASKAEQQAQKAVADANAVAMKASENASVLAVKLEDSERRAVKAEQQAQATARDLVSANSAVQAGQARLESAAREIEDAKKAATEARTAAKKSGEEAAELRGKLAAKLDLKSPKKPAQKAE